MLWIDLETRSQCDLRTEGLARYAQHRTTEVICASYAIDDEPIATWFAPDPFPRAIIEYIATGGDLCAHNASFERAMFDFVLSNDYDFTPPRLSQWQCSSARAMAHGLPGGLADICRAMGLPLQKMAEGARLLRDYSLPGFLTEFKPGDRELMQEYCETDVATMRMFCSCLRQLDADEWQQYHITETINDFGVPMDIPLAQAALDYADDIRADVGRRVVALTDGRVPGPTKRKARDEWLTENLPADLLDLITVKGKIKFDKEHREILANAPDLPEPVAEFVELVEQAGGSTISKYKAIVNTHIDGRVHGSLIWNGAGATGRYSSRNLQLQNFRRDVFDDPDPIIECVLSGAGLDKPADALGRLIRSVIMHPEGVTFSDYSQIEARVLPWLTGDPSAQATLDIFREGRDLYTETAQWMFNKKIDKEDPLRQASKMGVLACGFGGGARAVQAMAKQYRIIYSLDECEIIKSKWREANPWAVPFWQGLRGAAWRAYQSPGVPAAHGKLRFQYDGKDWLWMQLPSGRCLAYFQPRIELVETPWGDEQYEITVLWGSGKPKAGEKWLRRTLNHLILSENATQGAAADLMRLSIVRAHRAGLPVLFSVHDELVVQGECADTLHGLMLDAPSWAAGLPIDANTTYAPRYGK